MTILLTRILYFKHRILARSMLAFMLCSFISGCAITDFFKKGQTENTANQPSANVAGEEQPLQYFVAVDGLALYLQPSAASSLVARLTKHQKVLRTKLEKGYAYVSVPATGEMGWVDNAKLIWRLPTKSDAKKEAAPVPADQQIDTNNKSTAQDQNSPASAPSADSVPAPEPIQQPTHPTEIKSEPKPVEQETGTVSPAIFNSF